MKDLLLGTIGIFFLTIILVNPAKSASTEVTYKCVIRPVDGVWEILDDDNHVNSGCLAVSQTDGFIRVSYPVLGEITGSQVQIDDTMASQGIAAGGSVGFSNTRVVLGKRKNPSTVPNKSAIFFEVSGLIEE